MSTAGLDIAVVGSGICGMCTAMTLAERGHTVTLYERDGPPPEGDADAAFFDWNRRGAAQFRHPHAFLGLMCNLIADHYPDLLEAFYAAGARRVGFEEMLSPELKAAYTPAHGDEKLWVMLCRRATMETVIRRHVAALPGVTIRTETRVTGLLTQLEGSTLTATGLSVEDAQGAREVRADLVIDASGRTSRFPSWLAELGRSVPETKDDAEIVYYTRHYRLNPGEAEPPRGEKPGAGDLGYLKFGVFPGDNGNFAIILCLPVGERALQSAVRDPHQFDQICLSIPGLEPWLASGRASATTEPFGIADIHAVWRDFLDEAKRPLIHDFFAVGDAAVRTNPLYGRGCSLGILHARILTDVIAGTTDPLERAFRFAERTRDELRPIYDASLNEDQQGIRRSAAILEGRDMNSSSSWSPKKWFGLAFGDALSAAARHDISVLRGIMKTFHLLEKPGDFLKDGALRRRVFLYMLRGRRRNAASRLQPGPDRASMHQLLGLDPAASI